MIGLQLRTQQEEEHIVVMSQMSDSNLHCSLVQGWVVATGSCSGTSKLEQQLRHLSGLQGPSIMA